MSQKITCTNVPSDKENGFSTNNLPMNFNLPAPHIIYMSYSFIPSGAFNMFFFLILFSILASLTNYNRTFYPGFRVFI